MNRQEKFSPRNLMLKCASGVALLALAGCFGSDYKEVFGRAAAKKIGQQHVKVTNSKWSKFGSDVGVQISFKAKDKNGANVPYKGECTMKGEKVVRLIISATKK